MCRPASFDSDLLEIYPYLEKWYIHKFNRKPDQDTIPEAVTRALSQWEQYDAGRCKLSTWVMRILYNVELARNRHHNQHHQAGHRSPEFRAEMHCGLDLITIENAFKKLLPRQKAVLTLKAQGFKNREVAKRLKTLKFSKRLNTPGSMKSYINLARRNFKRELERAGYTID